MSTGYSSLSSLKRLPIDTLKIDQSFVRNTPADADEAAIATLIISMAHHLNLSVVAEGVETEEQMRLLPGQQTASGRGDDGDAFAAGAGAGVTMAP